MQILGLAYSVRRVELMFGQQSKNQSYEFAGSKSECTFMLMGFRLSVLFLVECSVFTAMVLHMAGRFQQVIPEVGIAALDMVVSSPRKLPDWFSRQTRPAYLASESWLLKAR